MYTELLAPAKDKETAIAAIDCGADAVYIGAEAYGARQNASNSLEDIEEVVKYAHKFWVKVFVTVNTILTDEELEQAVKLVKKLDEMQVDAVIIQDMGLLKRLVDENLEIPVHISTQCDNRDIEKVTFYRKLGVSRVVLARELSINQIDEIHRANPNLELEAFVHGALCVSYSGQCYLSQYIGGRSANRGECAQPCRKKYSVETTDGEILAKDIYALCLKDFNASRHLKEMAEAGVYSFKIEGRLKDSSYVKNVTAFYRHELDKFSKKNSSGRCVYSFEPNPEKSFNRGFTNYFLKGRGDCFNFLSPKSRGEYLGKIVEIKNGSFKIKTEKLIHPQDGLTNGKDGVLVNKIQNGYIYPNKSVKFRKGEDIYRNSDTEFEKLLSLPTKRQIAVSVVVEHNLIKLIDEDGVTIEMSLPAGVEANNPEGMKSNFKRQFSKTGETDFYITDMKINSDIPFLQVSAVNELRRKALNLLMLSRLENYKRQVQKSMSFQTYYKKEVDYRANIHNKEAKKFYEQCGTDVLEMSLEKNIPSRPVELMRTKHCIKYALNMCKSPKNLVLRDEFGKIYPLKFDCSKCEMSVLSN